MRDKAGVLRHNEAELQRLHRRVHETFRHRLESPEKRIEWQQAGVEFHARYDSLAFPGGLSGAYERILAGDPAAIDTALTFLEIRPFFFRSGYIWKALLQKCKRAPMSPQHSERFAIILKRVAEWKKRKAEAREEAQSSGGFET